MTTAQRQDKQMATNDSGLRTFRQSVSEADTTWLLCVELNASSDFRDWLADRLFKGCGKIRHHGAWTNVSTDKGESDVLWLVESAEKKLLGMVENKITAPAQPDQYARYESRGRDYVKNSNCDDFRIALLSPSAYRSEESDSYPIKIHYEDVCEWLELRNDERSRYLAKIYMAGIAKRNERTLAPEDPDMKSFHLRIWELADSCFPELGVRHPDLSNKSASQTWLYIRQPEFTIIYKMFKKDGKFGNCVVDLQLDGQANDVDQLNAKYKSPLAGTPIDVVKTGKSASFRISVPPIAPPYFEKDAVSEALRSASFLKCWWEKWRQDADY